MRKSGDNTRDHDEAVLRWVRLRCRGWSPMQIQRHVGYDGPYTTIAMQLYRVKNDDIAAARTSTDGDTPEAVEAVYWARMRSPRGTRKQT